MPDSEPNLDLPRPEHPRPDFRREEWINLNGRWQFTFDPQNVGEQMRWYRMQPPALGAHPTTVHSDPFRGEIVVPFPWESRLSHVGNAEYKGVAWYRRVIEIPASWAEEDSPSGPRDATGLPSAEDSAMAPTAIGAGVKWKRRPFLCFGAVDWHARVWVNGRFVAEHAGGYTPFYLDIGQYVRPGKPANLVVRAYDACNADTPLGKQTETWYTHCGGIWQTVWLEGRPETHLTRIHVTGDPETGSAGFRVGVSSLASGSARLTIESAEGAFPTVEESVSLSAAESEHRLEVRVPNPTAWSPEDPHLYDCVVRLAPEGSEPDEVQTYFGLRSVGRARWEGNEYEYVLLNGEPVYLRGVLDQAYHPDGLHTYPSDEAIRADLQAAKEMGLNMVRCHIKVNEPRYYYWADRLGLLVMYDLPSVLIYTPSARANWEATFRTAVERDFSHPSIFAWILFNETWGLEEHQTPASWRWIGEMFGLARELDPTRLIEDNSACLYDHVTTDLNTWHFYIPGYDRARRHVERIVNQTYAGSPFNYVSRHSHIPGSAEFKYGGQPLLNSEYAGLGSSGGDKDISYTFKFLTTELRRHNKICGYVYTELTDIEWEHNGLLNYDRTRKEFGYDAFVDGMAVADLNGADFVGLDCPPCQTLPPGSVFRASAFFSNWGAQRIERADLVWKAWAMDRFGVRKSCGEGRIPVHPKRFGVVDAGTVELRLPAEPCLVTVRAQVESASGIRARNYVNVEVTEPTLPVQERAPEGWALRFKPGDFTDCSWPTPMFGPLGNKLGATGAGWVEYTVPLPEELSPADVQGLQLLFEAGARTASYRIGWKRRWHPSTLSYPQTEERKLASFVIVSVNGIAIGSVDLPDDPADCRGVLSAHNFPDFEYASYGYLRSIEADAATTRRILDGARSGELCVRFEVPRSGSAGGLCLYGARMGAYPLDPTLIIGTGS